MSVPSRIDVYHHFPGADGISSELHALTALTTAIQELTVTLNTQGQAVVDAIATATSKLGKSITDATTAIADLVAAKSGNVSVADIQPSLDTLTAAADALEKTATAADPAVTPGAPPIAPS